jgi:hypothetical protein
MMTAIHFIKFIVKILLFIVLLPFFLLWACIRYAIFKSALTKELKNAGMPKSRAKALARELSIPRFFTAKTIDKPAGK